MYVNQFIVQVTFMKPVNDDLWEVCTLFKFIFWLFESEKLYIYIIGFFRHSSKDHIR